ncbi:MAG: PEGA domain-containing protein [Proteobacteria bacterium]|nr:PEGA domain-containing protein [Pseudomonadota bacterium]
MIPPTRSLQGTEALPGRLTIVSEPSGLEVILDGSTIGRTPIWLRPVEPGSHELKIEQAETDIRLDPGKIVRISSFKGSFVMVSEEIDKETQPEEERQPKALKAGREPPFARAEETTADLTPWEGFLNRSSLHF